MKKAIEVRRSKKANKGITLIALVITIIVLLILAGVSIAMLTGDNGILTKAQTAKTQTDKASAKEKVQIAVMGSYGANGKIDVNTLRENLKQTEGVTGAESVTSLPATVTVDGYPANIDKNGKVTLDGENIPGGDDDLVPTATLEEAIAKNAPLSTTENTVLEDKYKNIIVLPAGFKIGSDSSTDVTGGVVIEDVSHTATNGSEFVWIPVGTVYTNENQTTSEKIVLSRYTFANDADGTPTEHGEKAITINYKEEYGEGYGNIDVDFTELAESNLGNKVALNIEDFKTKATKNHGYYIGRYEARTAVNAERGSDDEDNGDQVTVKKDGYIYNYVTQPETAKLSKAMYSDTNFTSDLMNSYAWDTAIVFMQKFDNRTNKTKPYARQDSLNTGSLASQGTNHLEETNQDKICNIWDMASNVVEWTTETSSAKYTSCTDRGGGSSFYSLVFTAFRYGDPVDDSLGDFGFRPLLYM